jgi:uncharacterized coiled-coil DUF342 family protein
MEKHEASHGSEEKKTGSGGIGLGLGVDVGINLKLNELRSAIDMLTDALRQTGDTATSLVTDAVRKIRDVGVESFKEFKEFRGKEGEEYKERANIYDQTVSKLREAASRGEEEARDMLNSLGENVESAGQSMQSAASERHESSH